VWLLLCLIDNISSKIVPLEKWVVIYAIRGHMLTRQMLTGQMLTKLLITGQMLTTLFEIRTNAHQVHY